MTPNRAATILWDVQTAAELIVKFTKGRTLEEYEADAMLSGAVERQFTIIGEALVRLRRIAPDIAERIPDIAEIVAFRNVLVHNYDDINNNELWKIVQNDLPQLQRVVTELLRDVGPAE